MRRKHGWYPAWLLIACLLFARTVDAVSALASHPSPYLREHADDMIKWQTLESLNALEASEQQRPVLISSGYSACYWCFRMKQDTFRDATTGALVNDHFVPIIIDRELEPELDAWLQLFMERQRGTGGWPLSVILTPQGDPVAGFTYTPSDRFNGALNSFLTAWRTDADAVRARAQGIRQELNARDTSGKLVAAEEVLPELLEGLITQASTVADTTYGGFGDSEKFPFAPQLAALLELDRINPDGTMRGFLETTLAAMIGGGLRDHPGGGFFRYTDDRSWTAPHYEQMLYTQALMVPVLLQAGSQWKQPIYQLTAAAVLDGMLARFLREDGLFIASLSAVGEDGEAGSHYLWTRAQLDTLLGEDSGRIVNMLGEDNNSILPFILAQGERQQQLYGKLLEVRDQRDIKRDDKALLGWNGLALSALASGADLSDTYREAGERLARRLAAVMQDETLPQLVDRPEAGPASFTSRAYLARGLADWAIATGDTKLASQVKTLLEQMHTDYYQNDAWLVTDNKPILGRVKSSAVVDTQLPSPSGLWLDTAWLLARHYPELATGELASEVGARLPENLAENAFFHATLLVATLRHRLATSQARDIRTQQDSQ